MKKVLIYGGTTEGRVLAERLASLKINSVVSVATEYGEMVMNPSPYIEVRKGRLDTEQMRDLVSKGDFIAVIDATHPFAKEVTANIGASLENSDMPLIRILRDEDDTENVEKLRFFDSVTECAAALENEKGRIFLTTGSKDLGIFCSSPKLRERIVARVLPGKESLEICNDNGLSGKQIIAMQGPFSKEMDLAMIREINADILVTKESGRTGGVPEKIQAANEAGIKCFVIKRPKESEKENRLSREEAIARIQRLLKNDTKETENTLNIDNIKIVLAGIGPGDPNMLTEEVKEAIRNADIIFGAERMIEAFDAKEKYPYYLAKDIIPVIKSEAAKQDGARCFAVLFSGDTGFYSGCSKLVDELKKAGLYSNCSKPAKGFQDAELYSNIKIMPGISSVEILSARTEIPWGDAAIVSLHGVSEDEKRTELLSALRRNNKIFFIASGDSDVRNLGSFLEAHGYESAKIILGYQLSYPDEEIICLAPLECESICRPGLYCGFILLDPETFTKSQPDCATVPSEEITGKESSFTERTISSGIPDSEFIRGKVPMTKEEVRAISIAKLRIAGDCVLYDIGSGTGSVAIEAARLSEKVRVCAIENNTEAVTLIKKNREKFGTYNIMVVEGTAPEAFEKLPVPTHAFIGGTKGRLEEILEALHKKNPHVRVVMNAVTLESIASMQGVLEKYPVRNTEVVSVNVSRSEEAGQYHLMRASNPVYIFSFEFEG